MINGLNLDSVSHKTCNVYSYYANVNKTFFIRYNETFKATVSALCHMHKCDCTICICTYSSSLPVVQNRSTNQKAI